MLTPDDVRHVAMLARLGLAEDEIETMRGQLLQVLDYIAVLQELDTSTIPPTAQILAHQNITRPDEARSSLDLGALRLNAPGMEGDFFRVPAVLDEYRAGKTAEGGTMEDEE